MTGSECDLRKKQQRDRRGESRDNRDERREKREEISEKREPITINMRGSKDAMVRPHAGGMAEKRVGPQE